MYVAPLTTTVYYMCLQTLDVKQIIIFHRYMACLCIHRMKLVYMAIGEIYREELKNSKSKPSFIPTMRH